MGESIISPSIGVLGKLPLELRDKIYEQATQDIHSITIPSHFHDSLFVFVARRLPHCLLLNHQIFREAAMAYLRRTMLTMTSASVPGPENLLSQTPPSMVFKNLRSLEFTKPQDRYARSPNSKSKATPEESVHDVVKRSPILRNLTMTISAKMLFDTSSGDSAQRKRTFKQIKEKMQFSQLLEQKFMYESEQDRPLKFLLLCNDPQTYAGHGGTTIRNIFQPFEQNFMQEIKRSKSRLEFELKICPGAPGTYDPKWPELTWYKDGNITSYYYQDFFG